MDGSLLTRSVYNSRDISVGHFSVMQWNMLADGLGLDSFTKCPYHILQWLIRRNVIFKEISRWNADILCLEEVNHPTEIAEYLGDSFVCHFMPKPNSPAAKAGAPADGCMLCFRKDMFDSILDAPKRVVLCHSNQVAIFEILRLRASPNRLLVVGVSHFKASTAGDALRQRQAHAVVAELNMLVEMAGPLAAVIFCGDLNATPESAAITIILEAQLCGSGTAGKERCMSDAYAEAVQMEMYHPERGEHWTTWKYRPEHGTIKRAIDYIFYTKSGLRLCTVAAPPSEADVGENVLPCARAPSDHIPLWASFAFVTDADGPP